MEGCHPICDLFALNLIYLSLLVGIHRPYLLIVFLMFIVLSVFFSDVIRWVFFCLI